MTLPLQRAPASGQSVLPRMSSVDELAAREVAPVVVGAHMAEEARRAERAGSTAGVLWISSFVSCLKVVQGRRKERTFLTESHGILFTA